MKYLKFIILFVFIISIVNCTKDVDFDQIDQAEIDNSLLLTFAHFNLGASDFTDDSGTEINSISEILQLPIGDSTEEYLKNVEFKIISENSFNSEFTIDLYFLDSLQVPFYQLDPSIIVAPNSKSDTTTIEIPQADIYHIFDLEYVGFLVVKEDGGSSNLDAELVLKSSVELGFNFKKE